MSKIVYKKYSVYSKNLSTLFLVLFWLVLGFIVCFIGIKNTYASTYTPDNFTAQLFDNINGSLSYQETNSEIVDNKNIYYYGFINNLVANSAGGAWGISSPIPLINNHTYSMTVKTQVVGCGTTQLSSINRIGIGPDMGFAKYSYENNQYAEELYSKSLNSNLLQFVFKAKTDASYIIFPFSTSISCSNREVLLYDIAIEDLGSDGITQNEINTSLTNQTNTINNSIQNSTNIITGEINDMEQSIIDSNKETQDVIKDQFNSCRDSVNFFKVPNNQTVNGITLTNNSDGTFNLNGTATEDVNFSIYVPIEETGIVNNEIYTLSKESNYNFRVQVAFYNGDTWVRTPLNLAPGSPLYISNTIVLTNVTQVRFIITIVKETFINLSNVKIQLEKGSNATSWEPYGEEICNNRIDETNDKLNDLNNSLNNSDSTGATNDASNFFSNFTTDTFGLTSVITAPLSLINNITSSSCSILRLPLPYLQNEYLELPCMNTIYSIYFGSFFDIYQTITFGIVSYWVIVRIFNQIKDFKNPDHDEIEVLDL